MTGVPGSAPTGSSAPGAGGAGAPAGAPPRLRIAMIGAKGVPATVGGVERIAEELGARLAAQGHEVTVYCRREYSGPPTREPWRGIHRRWTPSLSGKYTGTLTHATASLLDALVRGFDILHIHSLGTAPIVPVAWLAGRRVLFHIHGQEWKGGKWGRFARSYFRACEPVALDFAHRVVVNTEASREYYRTAYGRETIHIPNAVEVSEVRSTGILEEMGLEPRKYLLFVGRLVPEKGCHHLLAAHRALGLSIPLVVVGEPAHSEAYATRLRAGAGPAVRFAGALFGDRLTELYARSLLLVNPTERDAVSLVLLEAMGQGAAVLASDIPEMLEGVGGAGFHFRSGDAADLAARLRELLDNPSRIESVREAARARVAAHFAWEPVTDRFEALYREMTVGRAG